MRPFGVASALLCWALGASAQQPTVPRTREDSIRAKAMADSLAIVRELEAAAAQAEPAQQQPAPGAGRLLPDVSAVGDLVGDLSPDRSTQADGSRFAVREVEVALQAAVDPFFRGDVFLGVSDAEGAAIEQAFLTTTALPWALQLRLGRFLAPFGKENTTHRHDLHTIEYPYVLQRFLADDGLKGTGIEASRIASPFGFYQELIVTALNSFDGGLGNAELHPAAPANEKLGGMGYTARLRNYWDLDQATNLELSFSAGTGKVPVPLDRDVGAVDAVNARRTLLGADLTFRWRPLQQGLYRSFILQAEVLRQLNEADPFFPAGLGTARLAVPPRAYTGAYAFARWQVAARGFVGARGDWLQDPELPGGDGNRGTLRAASLYYEFFPSEFSKLNAGFERLLRAGVEVENRLLVQATFALGPHKPHPF